LDILPWNTTVHHGQEPCCRISFRFSPHSRITKGQAPAALEKCHQNLEYIFILSRNTILNFDCKLYAWSLLTDHLQAGIILWARSNGIHKFRQCFDTFDRPLENSTGHYARYVGWHLTKIRHLFHHSLNAGHAVKIAAFLLLITLSWLGDF